MKTLSAHVYGAALNIHRNKKHEMSSTFRELPAYLERWPIDTHGQRVTKRRWMTSCCFLVHLHHSVALRGHISWQALLLKMWGILLCWNLTKVNSSPPTEIPVVVCRLGWEGLLCTTPVLVKNVVTETLPVLGSAACHSDNGACGKITAALTKRGLCFSYFK